MRNMLIRPERKDLEHFHPDYTIYNAGSFPANRYTEGMTSGTSVAINFSEKEMVILGTEYAGEMKKGVFTVLFYEMPVKHNVLTLHSSANEGKNGDVTVFFGLSGTGKTTLSADPNRALIGDDEHCWSDRGVFNIEGGVSVILLSSSVHRLTFPSATRNVSVFQLKRNLTFSAPSNLVQSSRMLSSTQRPVWSTTTTQHSQKTLVAHTLSSISKTPRSLACRRTTLATSFSSLVMPVVYYLLSPSLTQHKLCSTSFRVIPRRWLEQKTALRNHKQLSRHALHNRSWLYILCDMRRCWLTRLSNTRLMLGC